MTDTSKNLRPQVSLPRPAHRSWTESPRAPRAALAPNEIEHLRRRFWTIIDSGTN
jgi:hypothetical protein